MYHDERAAEHAVCVAEAEHAANDGDNECDALDRSQVRKHEIPVLELKDPLHNEDQSFADSAMRPKLPVYKDGEGIVSYIIRFQSIASC